jgi:hypothetical protein
MPVTTALLTAPTGEISQSFFPGMAPGDFDAMVTGILSGAEVKVNEAGFPANLISTRDATIKAAAYADAYRRAISYHSTRPGTVTLPDQQIQMGMTSQQLIELRRQQEHWEAEYQRLLEKGLRSVSSGQTGGTVSVPNQFIY